MEHLTDAVRDKPGPHPFDDVEVEEAHAIVDALALAVYADQEIGDDEEKEINELVGEMQWSWAVNLLSDGYVSEALSKAKTIVDEERVPEAAATIAKAIHDGRYPYLFEMLARIVVVDREVTYSETDFINAFAEAFGIDALVAADIVAFAEDVRESNDAADEAAD